MPKFPADAPIARVIRSLQALSFRLIRQGNHIAMVRDNADGTKTPLTMPNHRTILTRAGIQREEFLKAYDES